MTIEIKALTRQTLPILGEHFKRHRAESGTNGVHFMPFAPGDTNGPTGATVDRSFWPIDKPGWQRWFCIHELATGNIVGYVDLKTDLLRAGTHWCHLGIGIGWMTKGWARYLVSAMAGGQSAGSRHSPSPWERLLEAKDQICDLACLLELHDRQEPQAV